MIKIRSFPEEWYKAIFNNWKTIRLGNVKKLKFPEFYDIAINEKCLAGCSYCYVSAIAQWKNYENIIERITKYFWKMNENEKPFQVAIWWHWEPTLHPEFCNVLKTFSELWIVPNYTTNWMHINDNIIKYTKKYSWWIAVSCHPHLKKIWKNAANLYIQNKIKLNLHVIIWEKWSYDRFVEIYDEFHDKIDYIVALPYSASWRAKKIEVEKEWELFFQFIKEVWTEKIAFWANFYPYLLNNKNHINDLDIWIYEPEIMSWYLMFDTEEPILRTSSYDLTIRNNSI